MPNIEDWVGGAKTAAIVGHIRPDGDCIGSCLGLYHYLKATVPSLAVSVYLRDMHPKFSLLTGTDILQQEVPPQTACDLLFVLDCAEEGRIGAGRELIASAGRIICIDHHASNTGFGQIRHICPEASSTAEVLFHLMRPEAIDRSCAECLYTGIVHDTGVFRHSNTARSTMEAAAFLMDQGIDFSRIISETFFQKTFAENRMLGAVLEQARLHLDGAVISGVASLAQMEQYGITPAGVDGIVDSLQQTAGVQCAVFLYETEPGVYKASLRSKAPIRVSDVAATFGGGGHVLAAGCSLAGTAEEALDKLLPEIKKQFADGRAAWTES